MTEQRKALGKKRDVHEIMRFYLKVKFWEHAIRDEKGLKHHVDYIHYNPAKHGLVKMPTEWVLSSIHRYILAGAYPPDWGASDSLSWDNTVGRE